MQRGTAARATVEPTAASRQPPLVVLCALGSRRCLAALRPPPLGLASPDSRRTSATRNPRRTHRSPGYGSSPRTANHRMRLSVSSSAWSSSSKSSSSDFCAQLQRLALQLRSAAGSSRPAGSLFWHGRVRRQVRLVREAAAHRRGRQVELVHRRQAEDQLDRLHHARLVVAGRIDALPLRVRADDQRRRCGGRRRGRSRSAGRPRPRRCTSSARTCSCDTASTTRPRARSLSATIARGVGESGPRAVGVVARQEQVDQVRERRPSSRTPSARR